MVFSCAPLRDARFFPIFPFAKFFFPLVELKDDQGFPPFSPLLFLTIIPRQFIERGATFSFFSQVFLPPPFCIQLRTIYLPFSAGSHDRGVPL